MLTRDYEGMAWSRWIEWKEGHPVIPGADYLNRFVLTPRNRTEGAVFAD